MILLETLTGTGMALFYPASQALLPRLVPAELLQQASALSRLAMNAAQMAGAAAAGIFAAAAGPGWALTICGIGMLVSVPLLLSIRSRAACAAGAAWNAAELREGWSEVRTRTWLWAIVAQFCVIMMAWYGAFQVLGPVVAKQHLGGPAAWGAITAAESVGLIGGGLASLRFSPRRPMLFVVLIGAAMAISPLSPRDAVAAAGDLRFRVRPRHHDRNDDGPVDRGPDQEHPAGKLARVFAYDALGSVMAMPAGALVAGPIAAAIGVSATQYGAAAAILVASALALIPRDVRLMRAAASPGRCEAERHLRPCQRRPGRGKLGSMTSSPTTRRATSRTAVSQHRQHGRVLIAVFSSPVAGVSAALRQ